jgi:hypothetical protein
MAVFCTLLGMYSNSYAQSFDTIWISKPSALSKVEGEVCYVLAPKENGRVLGKAASGMSRKTTIDGNITYDYLYRSMVDTPFFTRNFQQHSIYGNIKTNVSGMYPVDVRFNIRKTNQPFLQNFFDFNVGLNPQQMANKVKQQIINHYKNLQVDSALGALAQKLLEYTHIQHSLDSLMRKRNKMQERVELREALFGKFPGLSIAALDSLIEGVGISKINSLFSYEEPELGNKLMDYRKSVMEQSRMEAVKDSIKHITDNITDKKTALEKYKQDLPDVNGAVGSKELRQMLRQNPSLSDSLPRHSNFLLSLKTFAIGRGILNYSELTAKDIALTGLNVEVNPSWYAAAAVGVINWQFRPFGAKNQRLPNQYAGIFRAGWGLTERAAIIFTYYKGARNLVYSPLPDSLPVAPVQRLQGVSAQLLYMVSQDHKLSFEFAKSSFARFHEAVPGEKSQENWLSFQDRSRTNEALSLIYEGHVKQTNTQITARYRQLGADFQCFTFFNTQANRNAWQWDVNQKIGKYFFARGGMQKNQSNFPGIENMKTDVVLSKAQAGFSKPKWPSVFIGYMPSSQIMIVDSVPLENNFQTLNAISTYAWRAGNSVFLSQASFTRFFNTGSDTGFIYFNASDFGISQQLSVGKWQFQAGYHMIDQDAQRLRTVDGSLSMAIRNNLTLSSNARLNTIQSGEKLFGYGGGLQWQIGRFGSLGLQAEKSFFPNLRRGLEPYETGRLTFMKIL